MHIHALSSFTLCHMQTFSYYTPLHTKLGGRGLCVIRNNKQDVIEVVAPSPPPLGSAPDIRYFDVIVIFITTGFCIIKWAAAVQ